MPKNHVYADKIRVWHVAQVPGKHFHVDVDDLNEAVKVRDALAEYDLFQFRNKIRGDFTNASGIEYFDPRDGGEWVEVDEDDIDDLLTEHLGRMPIEY